METVWQTHESDMALAREVIEQFARQNQGKLTLLEDFQEDIEGLTIRLSPWVDRLAAQFKMKYGEKIFPFILCKVIQELLSHDLKPVLSKEQATLFESIVHGIFHHPGSSVH